MGGLDVQWPSRSAAAAGVALFHTISSGDVLFVHRTRPLATSTLLNLRPRDLCRDVGRPVSEQAGGPAID